MGRSSTYKGIVSMGKTAFIFPGQGAQFPGMGKSYFDAYSEAKLIFEEADDILKRNLTKLLFEGSAEELTLTNNSQVAIFVTSIAMLQTLKQKPDVCAGLSLGEYSAITATSNKWAPFLSMQFVEWQRPLKNHLKKRAYKKRQ